MADPFTFAVLDFTELVTSILGHFFATLYRDGFGKPGVRCLFVAYVIILRY